jgi:hypothetical protein
MSFRSLVVKSLCVPLLTIPLIGGCGAAVEETGPAEEPNVGPGQPPGKPPAGMGKGAPAVTKPAAANKEKEK